QILRPSPFLEVSPYRAHAFAPSPLGGGRTFLQGLDALEEFREAFEYGGAFQPKLVINGRIPGDNLIGLDRVRDSGLSRRNDAVADLQVAGDSDLSCQNHAAADFRT